MSPVASERMIELTKAMQSSNCTHINGSDTDVDGFKLMIPDPDDTECDCTLVRSIKGGLGININVSPDKKNLIIESDNASSIISGGGTVTVDFRSSRQLAMIRTSDPITFTTASNQTISTTLPNVGVFNFLVPLVDAPTSFAQVVTSDNGIPMTPGNLLYVVDPSAFSAIASASFLRVFNVVSPINYVNLPSTSVLLYVLITSAFSDNRPIIA